MQSQAVQICIIQRSLEKQIQRIYQDLYKGRYKNWFTQLRRLRSSTMLSASWRYRRICDRIHSEPEGTREPRKMIVKV